MAPLRPAYLISGDDDAKIDAWRARVRRRAEAEGGPGALELFEATVCAPEDVAAALATLTLSMAPRYLIVDGVETWKAGVLDPLERALASIPAETVLVLIARGKPPARLAKAVEGASGELREYAAPKRWELPRWVTERARDDGLQLDGEAAKMLIELVGDRQQRLAREIEKLSLMAHPNTRLSAADVELMAAGEQSIQAYDLADSLVAGDIAATLSIAEQLRAREDRPGRLVFSIVRRLRDVHRAACRLDAGVPEHRVAATMALPPWSAKRIVAQARTADRDALERAICAFAALEVGTRGGAALDEDTAFTLTLAAVAG